MGFGLFQRASRLVEMRIPRLSISANKKILRLNEIYLIAQLRPLKSATAKSFCRAWHVGESAEIFLPEGGFYRWSKQ